MMKTTEIQNLVKTTAVEEMNLTNGIQIDDFTYAIPVEVEGTTRYAKVVVTCTNNKDTKTTSAFNIDTAVEAYAQKVADRAEAAAEKAKAKASKSK